MNNPFLPPPNNTNTPPTPTTFARSCPLPPSPLLPFEDDSTEGSSRGGEVVLPYSPPSSEPSSPLFDSPTSPASIAVPAPPSPSKVALPLSPPTSPTAEQSLDFPSTFSAPSVTPSASSVFVSSPMAVTPFEPSHRTSHQQDAPSRPVAQRNQSIQLPSDASDSAAARPSLKKKSSFLGLGSKRDRSVSAPVEAVSSRALSVVKKKQSLMGGLLRSLTGKGGKSKQSSPTSPHPPMPDQQLQLKEGLLNRGLSIIEDRSEKNRLEKEAVEQEAIARDLAFKNHAASLLITPSFAVPSSTTQPRYNPSSPRESMPPSQSMDFNDAPPIATLPLTPEGPNHRISLGPPVQHQPSPPRNHPQHHHYVPQPQFGRPSPPRNQNASPKPKLNVSVPTYTPSSSSPIPISAQPTSTSSYARPEISSGDSDSEGEDGEDFGLTIKKRTPVVSPTEEHEDLSSSASPTSPGLPATPPEGYEHTGNGERGFGSIFGSVRGGGGWKQSARPLTMHFGKAPSPQQQHYQQHQQNHPHYATYHQKQEHRQSRIPVAPVMHTAADVAAKIQAAEGEDQKNAEAFFM